MNDKYEVVITPRCKLDADGVPEFSVLLRIYVSDTDKFGFLDPLPPIYVGGDRFSPTWGKTAKNGRRYSDTEFHPAPGLASTKQHLLEQAKQAAKFNTTILESLFEDYYRTLAPVTGPGREIERWMKSWTVIWRVEKGPIYRISDPLWLSGEGTASNVCPPDKDEMVPDGWLVEYNTKPFTVKAVINERVEVD